MAAVRTTCPYCGVGCGVLATPDGRGGAAIAGDPEHPANFGRLCSKGAALGETLDLDGRLLAPRIGGIDSDWDSALDLVADKFRAAIRDHGPDSVAIYGSGQLLTEDYYVANKLMKGFVGSANIDTNSRLCMASSVAGHRRAFGADTVPGTYEDLELADLVVLVGSQPRLVPPGALPAHRRGQGGAAGDARGRHRPAPHRDLRPRRPASRHRRRYRRGAVQRLAAGDRGRRRDRRRLCRPARLGAARGAGRGATVATSPASPR